MREEYSHLDWEQVLNDEWRSDGQIFERYKFCLLSIEIYEASDAIHIRIQYEVNVAVVFLHMLRI